MLNDQTRAYLGGLQIRSLGQHREGGSILLGSIGSTPGIELLSPIPALARSAFPCPEHEAGLVQIGALDKRITNSAGSDRCRRRGV